MRRRESGRKWRRVRWRLKFEIEEDKLIRRWIRGKKKKKRILQFLKRWMDEWEDYC
jgi:hypothetical protein